MSYRTGHPQPPRLPDGLPVPIDDGASVHLTGLQVPDVVLRSTSGADVNLAALASAGLVLYVYPKIGRPGMADPPDWDQIPGARGCTQQSCAFRDLHAQFVDLGYAVAGLSAQPTEEQREAVQRLHLNFPLLADPTHRLGTALRLPSFRAGGVTLYKRLTLVVGGGRIVKVFYPVFPPDENAEDVLRWIRSEVS